MSKYHIKNAREFLEHLNRHFYEVDSKTCSFKFNKRGKIGVPDEEFCYFYGDYLFLFNRSQFVDDYYEYLQHFLPKFLSWLVIKVAKSDVEHDLAGYVCTGKMSDNPVCPYQ